MAQLRDSIVQGSLRVTDSIFTNTLDVTNFAQVGKIQLGVGNSSSSADANSRTISVTSDNLILEVPTGIVFRKNGTIGMRIDGKTLYPENDKTDGYTLGTSSKKWYKVYTQTLADSGDALWIKTESSNSIIFSINSVDKCRIDTNGYFKPETDNTLSIGTSSNRWANVYATTFNGALTGTASNATTTTETANALYPIGVTSGATTTLKRDTSITMTGGNLTVGNSTSGSLFVGTATASTAGTGERDVGVQNGSGKLYLYAAAATNGNKGLYSYATNLSTGGAILTINQSNQISGIATITGAVYINNTTDISGTGDTGPLVIGNKAAENIAIDPNEIMARKNKAVSQLNLNTDGGVVSIGTNVAAENQVDSTSTSTGILVVHGGLGVSKTVYATTFHGNLTGDVTGDVSGTASNATTTTETANALYPIGVTSGATTTLKRDTSITMTGAQLALGNLTIGGTKDTDAGKTIASNSTIYLKTTASASVIFSINSTSKCRVDTDGHLRPETNNGVNLGITSVRWKTGYFVTSVEVGTASKAINATDAAGAQIAPTVITQNSIATGGGFYLTQKGTGAARLAVTTLGTTSAGGVTTLTLGNGSNSTTNYNSQGKIVLYSANTAAHTIDTTSTTTAYTHTLSNATGTIAHTADITSAIQALDVTAITGSASKTLTSISETDGKISATYSDISIGAGAIASGTVANARLPARLQEYHTTATDTDSTFTSGWHYSSTNSPFTKYHSSNKDFMVWAHAHTAAKWGSEIATDFRSNRIAVRNINNGTWNSWKELGSFTDPVNEYSWTSDIIYDDIENQFTLTRTTNGWASQVYSKHGFSDGCYISFRVVDKTHFFMLGLNSDPTTDANQSGIDYAWYIKNDGTLQMRESNTAINSIDGHTTYNANDDFRIEYSDGYIRYYHNGVLCRSVARSISGQLYLDTSFYNGGSIKDLRFGPLKNGNLVSKDLPGLAPKGAAVSSQSTSTKFLREDGTWAAPSYISNAAYGNITTAGAVGQTSGWALASGDALVVCDSSNSNKLERTGITFDASTATQCLTKKGTWVTFCDLTSAQTFTGNKTFKGVAYFANGTTYYVGTTGNAKFNTLTAAGAATMSSTLSVTGVASFTNTTGSTSTSTGAVKISGGLGVAENIYGLKVYNAVWNDYAECRNSWISEPGRVITEDRSGTMELATQRLMPACKVVSDTYGTLMGESETAKTPIAVAGRVLVYPYKDPSQYQLGDAVCSAPNGTVDIMSRDEITMFPERIIGTVSEIPTYKTWNAGSKENPTEIKVNGRIWIYVR